MKLYAIVPALMLFAVPVAAQEKPYQKDPGTTNRTGEMAPAKNGASKMTQRFTKNAASSNTLEVETSRLALEKSKNGDVKQFAQMMIDDHTKAGENLKAAMKEAGLPAPADKMAPKHKDMADNLRQVKDAKFDTEYVAVQLKAHEEAVNLFSKYAKSGDNKQLQQFAQNTLPVLEKHKTAAEDLRSKVTAGGATQ